MVHVKALAGSVPSSASVPSPLNEITSPARKIAPSVRRQDRRRRRAADADRDRRRERSVLTPSETVSRAVYWPACV